MIVVERFQSEQHTKRWRSVTADTNCCTNCVETTHPHQWGPDLPFFLDSRTCGPAGWLALLLTKAGDVDTNPDHTNEPGFSISAINK